MTARLRRLAVSFLDPMTYLHVFRILHFYGYAHVRPRRRVTLGPGATLAPNVSLRNGERITIGAGTQVGERVVPLGRRLDWARDDRRALPPRAGSLRHGIGLRHASRREDRPPGAQRARHRDRKRRLARCPRLRGGRGDHRRRLRRQRELGRHEIVASELHRSGEPREDRSQAGGLRRQRTGARRRPRHRRSTRGEAGRLDRRRDVQVPGRGGRLPGLDLRANSRRLVRGRRRGERLRRRHRRAHQRRVPGREARRPTRRTSASPPGSIAASRRPRASICFSSIPTASSTRVPSASSSSSPGRTRATASTAAGRCGRTAPCARARAGESRRSGVSFCFSTLLSTVFKGSRVFDPESLGGWQRDTVREVDIVTGCLLLAPREVWDELGGFDERFFMYGEDGDLALRAAGLGLRRRSSLRTLSSRTRSASRPPPVRQGRAAAHRQGDPASQALAAVQAWHRSRAALVRRRRSCRRGRARFSRRSIALGSGMEGPPELAARLPRNASAAASRGGLAASPRASGG